MKKRTRFAAILICVILVMSLASGFASAAGKGLTKTDKAAPALINNVKVLVKQANRDIDKLVKIAKSTPADDTDWLLAQIDLIVTPVFEQAERVGVNVVCEMVSMEIDGKIVDIDPIRVID